MPGRREDDLVIGKNGASAVATLTGRTSRFLILVPLTGRDSLTVGEAIIAATRDPPRPCAPVADLGLRGGDGAAQHDHRHRAGGEACRRGVRTCTAWRRWRPRSGSGGRR